MISLFIFAILFAHYSKRDIVEHRYSTTGSAVRFVLIFLILYISLGLEYTILLWLLT